MNKEGVSGFKIFKFGKLLQEAIDALNWLEPTPVQQQVIPIAKSGKDILAIAQTGTGKTGAYLLPLITKLHFPQGSNTRALILAPTRELATQIVAHFQLLNTNINLRCATLIGGMGPTSQLKEILAGTDLVVATPGRFLEIYATNQWILKDVKTLVIDEADRMMDMGFMPQIRLILEKIPSKRQNMLFSATFPPRVDALAAEFLEFPERLEISPQSTPAESVDQSIIKTKNFQTKLNVLLHHLKRLGEDDAALVFVKTKQNATEIGKFLDRKLSFPVAYLHANKGTATRAAALSKLHRGEVKVLVTTDVSSRGLDIPLVTLVINFDLPIQYEDYVHRIGRTGRANRLGSSISFVNAPDELHLDRIEKLIRSKIAEKPVPDKLEVEKTPLEEQQEMDRKLDEQRKRADPDFKGAFHEKKLKNQAPAARKQKQTKNLPQAKSDSRSKPTKARTFKSAESKAFKPKSPSALPRQKRRG